MGTVTVSAVVALTHDSQLVDKNLNRAATLNSGLPPIAELGLAETVRKGDKSGCRRAAVGVREAANWVNFVIVQAQHNGVSAKRLVEGRDNVVDIDRVWLTPPKLITEAVDLGALITCCGRSYAESEFVQPVAESPERWIWRSGDAKPATLSNIPAESGPLDAVGARTTHPASGSAVPVGWLASRVTTPRHHHP